jgi:hypothetical protein
MYEARVKPWLLPKTAQALALIYHSIVFRRDLIIQGPSCRNIVVATDPDWVARRVFRRAHIAGACILRIDRTYCRLALHPWKTLAQVEPHKR